MGGLRQNDDVLTLWRLRGGRLETLSKYCCKILEIMNKLMNFFMNHGLIFLNTAPTPQNIVLMIVEKHILIIWNVSEKSSSNSTFVHILHHHFRGWGVQSHDDVDDFLSFQTVVGIKCPLLVHWELGAGAQDYKIWLKLDFLLKYLCALPGSPRYLPPPRTGEY